LAGFFVSALHHPEVRETPLWHPPAVGLDRRHLVRFQRIPDLHVPGAPGPVSGHRWLFSVDCLCASGSRGSGGHFPHRGKYCARQRWRPRVAAQPSLQRRYVVSERARPPSAQIHERACYPFAPRSNPSLCPPDAPASAEITLAEGALLLRSRRKLMSPKKHRSNSKSEEQLEAGSDRARPILHQKAREIQPFGKLTPMPIALDENVRAESVGNLNQVLADTMTLRDMYKKHHWQVAGHTFYQLHLLFDKHHD